MTVIYRTILKIITVASLLLRVPIINCQTLNQEKQFRKGIEYWTEALCSLQNTKTFVFHGIFMNDTRTLQNFFDILLHTTAEYCSAVVLLKIYTLPNFHRDGSLNRMNSNTGKSNVDANRFTRTEEEYNVVNRQEIWKLVSMVNHDHHQWNIKRSWRRNNNYDIDIRTMNVIFLGDSDSFEKLLDSNIPSQWNSKEHFIVLAVWNDLLTELSDRKPLIDKMLRKLWLEYQILNVFFDEPLSSRDNSNLYSYNPFARNGKTWGRLENVNGTSKRRMLRSLSKLMYRRAVNFNGYRFNVSIFDQGEEATKIRDNINTDPMYAYSGGYGGPSGILLSVLAQKLNFAVNVIEPNTTEKYGNLMENGMFSGAIGDVVYRRVVASFASFFVKPYADDMSSMEFTATVGFDKVCIIVPKAGKIPKGLRIFYIFDSFLWMCMALSVILVYLLWHYVQAFSPTRSKRMVYNQSTALRVFFISTGYPIPLPCTFIERYLVMSIVFCSMTMTGIFNSLLYKSFATDMFYGDINDLAELDASEFPIAFGSYSITDIFGSPDSSNLNPVLKSLQHKMIHLSDATKIVVCHRNVSNLIRHQFFTSIHQLWMQKSGLHLLHLVEECPAKFYLACVLPKNSFLRERMNVVIDRLNQAGLPALWRSNSLLENALKMKVDKDEDQKHKNGSFVAFQLSDLQISFFVLAIGLLLSTVAFFNEKGWLRLCLKKPRTRFYR